MSKPRVRRKTGPPKSRKRKFAERTAIEQPSPTVRMATLIKRYVDREADILLEEGISIRVRIVDVRKAYGRTEFLVEPIVGSGQLWVTHLRLMLVDEEAELEHALKNFRGGV